ncbi:MAG: lipid-binding SYLF domain-containing protein [Magnetospirillum sp.]|nr:lipid-binding SYLF domain-containing protein [Magnetospirillum sp.]
MFVRFAAATVVLMSLAAPAAAQQVVTDQTMMVGKAQSVVERLRSDPHMESNIASLLGRARAVLIIPDLVKGGFILGAEYGTGVLLTRDGSGSWSGPAFYSVASGSVGLQIGVQDAEAMFLIMTEGGLRAVMDNRFKAGADAGVAVLHVGAGAEAATTLNAGADIYAFSKAVGAYGGASLEGSAILPRHSWNAAYYGGNPAPEDILIARRLDAPQASRLRDLLAR